MWFIATLPIFQLQQQLQQASQMVEQLGKARDDAAAALELTIELERRGWVGKEQVIAAEKKLTEATLLYRDSLGDTTKAIELRTRAQQADLSITSARAGVEQRQLERMAEEARRRGDLTTAMNLFFESARDLATDPASVVSRSIFLRDADGLAACC